MRVALLSDIHANLPALDAVLRVCAEHKVDRYLSAGDMVGYGPHPGECIDRLRDIGVAAVVGNHELFVLDRLAPDAFSARARASLVWTRRMLGRDHMTWLSELPERLSLGPVVAAHAALDSVQEYVIRPQQGARQLRLLAEHDPDARVLVLGHTHQPLFRPETGRSWTMSRGGTRRLSDRRTLINPGSVGQSRQWERAPRARFAVLDVAPLTVRWFAVDYDRPAVLGALAQAGLPAEAIHVRPSPWRALMRALRAQTDLSLPSPLRPPRAS